MNLRSIGRELAVLTLFQIFEPTKTLSQVSEEELLEQALQLICSESRENLNLAINSLQEALEFFEKSDSDNIDKSREHILKCIEFLEKTINIIQSNFEWPSIYSMSFISKSREYTLTLIKHFRTNKEEIDKIISQNIEGWTIDRLAKIDLNIIRISVIELLYEKLSPPIVIDEAVEISKKYSDTDSYRFINSVLKRIVQYLKNNGYIQ